MKRNITPVTLLGENDKARIKNALFKVKLLALVTQHAALLKGNFPYAFFFWEFPGNCSSKFLLVAGSELAHSKASLSNTRKASQDQIKIIPCNAQTGFSENVGNVQEKEKYLSPASVVLPCDFIIIGLHHGYFSRNIPTFFGIFICLLSQIIIVLIGMLKGNYRSVIGEALQLR